MYLADKDDEKSNLPSSLRLIVNSYLLSLIVVYLYAVFAITVFLKKPQIIK